MAVKILSNGKWYEPGRIETIDGKAKYLDLSGQSVRQSLLTDKIGAFQAEGLRHPLTECEPPQAYVLGADMLASMEEKYRSRAVHFRRSLSGESALEIRASGWFFIHHACNSEFNRIILSPPAPEPKGPEELLADIIEAYESGVGAEFAKIIEAGKQGLAAQPDE